MRYGRDDYIAASSNLPPTQTIKSRLHKGALFFFLLFLFFVLEEKLTVSRFKNEIAYQSQAWVSAKCDQLQSGYPPSNFNGKSGGLQ